MVDSEQVLALASFNVNELDVVQVTIVEMLDGPSISDWIGGHAANGPCAPVQVIIIIRMLMRMKIMLRNMTYVPCKKGVVE